MDITAENLQTAVESAIAGKIDAAVAKGMSEEVAKLTATAADRHESVNKRLDALGEKFERETPAAEALRDPKFKGAGLNFAKAVLSIAIAKFYGKDPVQVAEHRGYKNVAKALQENSSSAGGALVPDQYWDELVPLLYAAQVVMQAGARSVSFKGSMTFPMLASGASASHVGEAQAIAPSQPAFALRQLQAKKIAALVPISNDMLRNPSTGIESIVRDDMVQAIGVARDLACLRGAGTAYTPRGVSNWLDSGNAFNQGGTAISNIVADYTKLIRLIEETNRPEARRAFIMSPRTAWGIAATANANGLFPFLETMTRGTLFGYPVLRTTNVPNNLSTDKSEVYFGEWSDLLIGEDTALVVEFLKDAAFDNSGSIVSGASSDLSVIRGIHRYDVTVARTKSFARLDAVSVQ